MLLCCIHRTRTSSSSMSRESRQRSRSRQRLQKEQITSGRTKLTQGSLYMPSAENCRTPTSARACFLRVSTFVIGTKRTCMRGGGGGGVTRGGAGGRREQACVQGWRGRGARGVGCEVWGGGDWGDSLPSFVRYFRLFLSSLCHAIYTAIERAVSRSLGLL